MARTTDHEHYLIGRLGAQRSATTVQIIALSVAGACILAAALLQKPINAQRSELELVSNSNIYEGLPPRYAWISAAGATFRGLAADLLWTRMEELKQEGKYYEAHQLAKWICTVQPRFPKVWEFQAWNMAYNISVGTKTRDERWQWVYNGLRLLRDEGIPHNEKSVPLYYEMAWIYFHKVGDLTDDFHMAYKRMWAARMHILLGEPPLTASDAEAIDWFRPVAEAPHDLAELIAARPGVKPLVEALRDLRIDVTDKSTSSDIWHPLEKAFFKPYTRWEQSNRSAFLRDSAPDLSEAEQALHALFAQGATDDLNALLAWMRAKVLRELYKMDPQFMLDMSGYLDEKRPIPIDWRTPWAHSLYWAMYGSAYADPDHENVGFRSSRLDRVLLFNMKVLLKGGQFVFRPNVDEPFNSYLNLQPNLRWLEPLNAKYIEMGPKYADPGEDVEGRTCDLYRSGHINDLEQGIRMLYMAGDVDQAREYLAYLARYYPNQYTNEVQQRYLKPVDVFVHDSYGDIAGNYYDTKAILDSLLENAYMSAERGDISNAVRCVQLAMEVHEGYQKDKRDERGDRRSMPEFEEFLGVSLAHVVAEPRFDIVTRSLIWRRVDQFALPPATVNRAKQFAYFLFADQTDQVRAECHNLEISFELAFPAPTGLDAFRAEMEAQWRELQDADSAIVP